jgi:hypothetical protein
MAGIFGRVRDFSVCQPSGRPQIALLEALVVVLMAR